MIKDHIIHVQSSYANIKLYSPCHVEINVIVNTPIKVFFGHFKCEDPYEDCKNVKDLKPIIDYYMICYNYKRPQDVQRKK